MTSLTFERYSLNDPLTQPDAWAIIIADHISHIFNQKGEVFYEIFDWHNNEGFEYGLIELLKGAGELGVKNKFDYDRECFHAKFLSLIKSIFLCDWSIEIYTSNVVIIINDGVLTVMKIRFFGFKNYKSLVSDLEKVVRNLYKV